MKKKLQKTVKISSLLIVLAMMFACSNMVETGSAEKAVEANNVNQSVSTQTITIPETGEYFFNMNWFDASAKTEISMTSPGKKVLKTLQGTNPDLGEPLYLGFYMAGETLEFSIKSYYGNKWHGPVSSTHAGYFRIAQAADKIVYTFEDAAGTQGDFNDGEFTVSWVPESVNKVVTRSNGYYFFKMDWFNAGAKTEIRIISPETKLLKTLQGSNPPLGDVINLGYYKAGQPIEFSIRTYWGNKWYGPISSTNEDYFKVQGTFDSTTYTFEDAAGRIGDYNDGKFTIYTHGPHPLWDATETYTAGDFAVYESTLYKAKWWTKGDTPGASQYGPWEKQ